MDPFLYLQFGCSVSAAPGVIMWIDYKQHDLAAILGENRELFREFVKAEYDTHTGFSDAIQDLATEHLPPHPRRPRRSRTTRC